MKDVYNSILACYNYLHGCFSTASRTLSITSSSSEGLTDSSTSKRYLLASLEQRQQQEQQQTFILWRVAVSFDKKTKQKNKWLCLKTSYEIFKAFITFWKYWVFSDIKYYTRSTGGFNESDCHTVKVESSSGVSKSVWWEGNSCDLVMFHLKCVLEILFASGINYGIKRLIIVQHPAPSIDSKYSPSLGIMLSAHML